MAVVVAMARDPLVAPSLAALGLSIVLSLVTLRRVAQLPGAAPVAQRVVVIDRRAGDVNEYAIADPLVEPGFGAPRLFPRGNCIAGAGSLHDLSAKDINGTVRQLGAMAKGKVVLAVNVASY